MRVKVELEYEGDVNIIAAHTGGFLTQFANVLLAASSIGSAELFLRNLAESDFTSNDPELKFSAKVTLENS